MSPDGEARRGDGPPLTRLVVGALLVVAGLVWLLDATGVIDFPLRAILPIALVLTGVALLVGSGGGSHPGLIALGVVLTLVLTLGSVVLPRGPVRGDGVGQRAEIPTDDTELRRDYRLGLGELVLDLRRLDELREDRETRVRVGTGRLVVLVPEDLPVRVEARAGVGRVEVFGREASGVFGVEQEAVRDGSGSGDHLRLRLSVGMGEVDVQLRDRPSGVPSPSPSDDFGGELDERPEPLPQQPPVNRGSTSRG